MVHASACTLNSPHQFLQFVPGVGIHTLQKIGGSTSLRSAYLIGLNDSCCVIQNLEIGKTPACSQSQQANDDDG